ncbi:piRNA biogenesis protein EXD1 isoform X2 [Caloenas nicobarica]|uniref:piRNA biogenesis protein EXD1 isoform X2 n=1 Tax=Caloenas nicobarica TaxID=187106 RepID=UPI0032B7FD15
MALSSEHFGGLVGRTVRVTLKCGVFQGVLQHVNRGRSLLLRTVKNLETGRSTRGVKMFFDHEIVNVELLDELDSGKGTAMLSEFNKPDGDIITVRPHKNDDPQRACARLQKEEASFTQGYPKEIIACLAGARAHSRIYPEENHSPRRRCTSAVKGNKQADSGPADCGPQSSPCVSLESQFRASSSLKYSLSEKKEEETVEYIVVDCLQQKFGPAVLQLKQQHVVSVAGEGVNLCRYGKLSWLEVATKSCIFLFDIFLLGPQAFKNGLQMVLEDKNILKVMHDCRWISDCLFHQYGVLLFNVFDTQENPDIWFLRPFPASLLEALALKAMYLLLLHSSLMDSLMSDLTAVVHDYLNVYRTGSGDHLGSTKPICMELPEELRQLADIQKLRREKAIKEYRMNEDGLLIRPAMELKERDDPHKNGNYRDDGDWFPTNKVVSQITSFFNEGVLCPEKLENQNQVVNL